MLMWGQPPPAVRSSKARRFPHHEQSKDFLSKRNNTVSDSQPDDELSYLLAIDAAH
jgi:hypothetical protein